MCEKLWLMTLIVHYVYGADMMRTNHGGHTATVYLQKVFISCRHILWYVLTFAQQTRNIMINLWLKLNCCRESLELQHLVIE